MKQIMKIQKNKIMIPVIMLGIFLMTAGCLVHLWSKKEGSELPVLEDGYYEIDSAEDFCLFWEMCDNDPYAGGRLVKDIYLNEISDDMGWKEWEHLQQCWPVDEFRGTFDGNGYTIYGLYSNKGYGLVRRNHGTICNLWIRNSVVYGNYASVSLELAGDGGICKENYGVISKCDFGGKLYASADSDERLSGICYRNLGMIEECGFSGTIVGSGSYFEGKVSGICMKNQGEAARCYNLADLHETIWSSWPSECFQAITDQGETQCFLLKDSGWDVSESGQTAVIKREQAEYISSLVSGDFYELLAKSPQMDEKQELQEILSDKIVSDLIMNLIVAKGENWDNLSLETDVSKESVRLMLSDKGDKIVISICPAWQERAGWGEAEDYERLWQQCAEILGEKGPESFEHSSWQMVTEQEGKETVFGNFVRFQTNQGRRGFFLQKDQRLYRVESKENQEKASHMYNVMLQKLWDGRTPSVGISWRCEEIRDAALAGLEAAREQEAEQAADSRKTENMGEATDSEQEMWEMTPSREKLYTLETLLIAGCNRISSLEDLAKMPHLKSLSFLGDESSYVNYDLEKGMVPELEDLWISGMKLSNLDFLEQMPQLKNLFIWDCGLEDISGIRHQKELTSAFLDWNAVRNIYPLRSCKKLETLSLSYNSVADISPIASLTKLREINISHNEILSIEQLWRLRNLESVSCDGNKIQNIDPLKYLPELRNLNLADNQIEDFEPITGLTGLRNLDIRNNPGQNVGDLIFLPGLIFGNGTCYQYAEAEEWEDAQTILENFYPQEMLPAKDMVKGDLNGDDIPDMAIAVLNEESEDSEGDSLGKIYVFWGKEDGTFRRIPPIDMSASGCGVYFYGMLITNRKLAVQAGYSGFSEEHRQTSIYEYEKGKIREKWNFEFIDEDNQTPGFDFQVTDKENQHETHYAIVEDKWSLPEILDEEDRVFSAG